MREYYKILNVKDNASQDEIKKAYRKLAIQNHPDKGGDSETFKKINEAYSVLSDSEKRSSYDKYGQEGLNGSFNMNSSDIFSQFFNNSDVFFNSSKKQQKTKNTYTDLYISLEEMCTGVIKKYNIKRKVVDKSKIRICDICNGTGVEVKISRLGVGIISQQQTTCSTCKGNGSFAPDDAYDLKIENIEIDIYKGCPEGTLFTYSGMVNEEPGKLTGDLIFNVKYKKHKFFKILKNSIDLVCDLNINLLESLIGFNRIIEHPSGEHIVIGSERIIKPGKYAIFGKGIQLRSIKRGNIYINLKIQYPDKIHETETTLSKILGQTQSKLEKDYLEIINVPEFEPTDISMYLKSQKYSNDNNGCTQS